MLLTKSTGIRKCVDKLGRFKFPKELRRLLNIEYEDSMIMHLRNNNEICCTKKEDSCIICHSRENIHLFQDKMICEDCIAFIKVRINKKEPL